MLIKFLKATALLVIVFIYSDLNSQNSDVPKAVSKAYFLQNCFVVIKPGTILSNQNVSIKNGYITEIGPKIKPPFDAQWVKADSMFVYAGFIDAYSNTGISKSEPKDRPKVQDPGNPPNELAGITPHFKSTETYKPSDKSVTDMRSAGFSISNAAPRGHMLPGMSNLFLLGDGLSDKMVMQLNTGQSFQLEPNRGIFPATTIGVIAKFRELYMNASIAGIHQEKYRLNPSGLERPDYSKELMALYPVTHNKIPLYFIASKTKDIHKALSLKNELGFDMVLTEVKQGWHYLDKIKNSNVGILLSLELPEEEKKETKEKEKKDSISIVEIKKIEKKEVNPEKDYFDAKKQESIKQYLSQASVFEKSGIKFGFSFLNVKPDDIKKNIRRLIDNGLSENAALAALTINPAQMFGISDLVGTVEVGKIANLVVTDNPYFDQKSSIKYVFVDGIKYDYSSKPKKDNKSTEGEKFVGTWTYAVEIPGSIQKGKINITKAGGKYRISIVDDSDPNEEDIANDIVIDGSAVTFNIIADMGQPTKVDFELKFDQKSYTGNVNVAQIGIYSIKGDLENDPKFKKLNSRDYE